MAIALAINSTRATTIISDSKSAILNFSKGRISPAAASLLEKTPNQRKILLIWTPAHCGLQGNELAHATARALVNRAVLPTTPPQPPSSPHKTSQESQEQAHVIRSHKDRLVTYRDIINHYRLSRCKYPPAHHTLSRKEAVTWRRLQTNTFPSPVSLNRCYPDLYSNLCTLCNSRADLHHMIWSCHKLQKNTNGYNSKSDVDTLRSYKIKTAEQWETVLLSSTPEAQLTAVRMAEAAARIQGILADG